MTSFLKFAELCQKVEGTSGSLEKIDLVAAFLRELEDQELGIASNFVMGTVFPDSETVLGVGPKHTLRSFGQSLRLFIRPDTRDAKGYW